MSARVAPLAIGAIAGLAIAIQIRLNASLGERLGSSLFVAHLTFLSALVLLLPLTVLGSATSAGLDRVATLRPPPWMFLSGAIGAANVATFTAVVPTIGTALFTVAAVTGQMLGGILVDAFGLGVAGRRAPTPPRVAGAGLAIAAIVVTQIGKPVGEVAAGLILIALAVNVGVALQLALNGRLNQAARDPVTATLIHFTVGTVALTLVMATVAAAGDIGVDPFPSQPWLYLGGVCGIALIGLISITMRQLDVLRAALVINGGQLAGALVLDAALPEGPGVSVWLALGAGLTLLAVWVASR